MKSTDSIDSKLILIDQKVLQEFNKKYEFFQEKLEESQTKIQESQTKIQELQDQMKLIMSNIVNPGSERSKVISTYNPNQLSLGVPELSNLSQKSANTDEDSSTVKPHTRKKRGKNEKLKDGINVNGLQFGKNVDIKQIELPIDGIQGLVEGVDYDVVNQTSTFKLAQNKSYSVLEYINKTIKLKESNKLVNSSINKFTVLENSYADVSFLANLVIEKFEYHMPLHRQHKKIANSGIKISRNTLTNYIKRVSELLKPIYSQLLVNIKKSEFICMDETTLKAEIDKERHKMKQGYLWNVYGKEKDIVFHYDQGRGAKVITDILGDNYQGVLLSDKYSAYFKYANGKNITQACCWAHARRKFTESLGVAPKLSNKALNFIKELYRIESEIKGFLNDDILRVRKEKSIPVVKKFFKFLEYTFIDQTLISSNLFTRAANYSLGIEKELQVYLTNPNIPIDNNHVEREMRPVAVGRKNWMFCQTKLGAENSAILYSILASARIQGINTYEYLVDVMQRIHSHPKSKIDDLIPRNWINNKEIQDEKLVSLIDIINKKSD